MSHFTLDRHYPIDQRIAAAGAAGIAGIGLYVGDWEQKVAEGLTPAHLQHLLDRHDVVLAEIEAIPIWTTDGAAGERTERFLDLAWQLADHFGSRYLQVIGPFDEPFDAVAERFGQVCDRASEYGMKVGIEFLAVHQRLHCRRRLGDSQRSRSEQRWPVRRHLASPPRRQRQLA